jgi:hypothetical protein
MTFLVLSQRDELLGVIVRTKNSERLIRECLNSICAENPVRRIIMRMEAQLTERLKITSSFPTVEVNNTPKPDLSQGTNGLLLLIRTLF